jgi:hypothetical protein
MHSSDMLHKANGDILDQFHSDQKVLDNQAGEAGPFCLRPRVSKLTRKTIRLESTQIMVLVSVRREASPCEWRPTRGLHFLRMLK